MAVQANILHEPVDVSINRLKEGQETILKANLQSLTAMSVLQRDFETRLLSSIELKRLNGNPKNFQILFNVSENKVHRKIVSLTHFV